MVETSMPKIVCQNGGRSFRHGYPYIVRKRLKFSSSYTSFFSDTVLSRMQLLTARKRYLINQNEFDRVNCFYSCTAESNVENTLPRSSLNYGLINPA